MNSVSFSVENIDEHLSVDRVLTTENVDDLDNERMRE
jgi:hypothetical protein